MNNQPFASLILRSEELNPQEITSQIGVNPSSSFKKGDLRREGKFWPHGFWELNSSEYVKSNDISVHIEWILDKIYPAKLKLISILDKLGIEGEISCFWVTDDAHAVVNLNRDVLSKITSLGLSLEFDFYFEE